MDSSRTSLDLLAYFDSPKTEEIARLQLKPVGVIRVLNWATAASVLFFAACVLLQLGYCTAAERMLADAARAGALEATLPRATRQSIVRTVERRLLDNSISTTGLQIGMQHNDTPMQSVFRLADDDRVAVAISLPTDTVLPAWLNAVALPRGGGCIEVRAERRVPGRELRTLP